MLSNLQTDLKSYLRENTFTFNLTASKEIGIIESLFLLYLNWECGMFYKPMGYFKTSYARSTLGIPLSQLFDEIIPKIQKRRIGGFTIFGDEGIFLPNPIYDKIITDLTSKNPGMAIFFPIKIARDFTYKDALNLGILLTLASEFGVGEGSDNLEFKFESDWKKMFYPNYEELFNMIDKLHSNKCKFVEVGFYHSNPDDLYICFHLNDLKKYFDKGGLYEIKI